MKQKTLYAMLDRVGDIIFMTRRPTELDLRRGSAFPKGSIGFVTCRRVKDSIPTLTKIPEGKCLKVIVQMTVVKPEEDKIGN